MSLVLSCSKKEYIVLETANGSVFIHTNCATGHQSGTGKKNQVKIDAPDNVKIYRSRYKEL